MEELRKVIEAHLEKYPDMRPEDLIKLIYQNEFGPAHAARDAEKVLAAIKEECAVAMTEEGDADMFTPIGNYMVRVDFKQALTKYTPEQIADWFIRSAVSVNGSMAEYMKKIKWVDNNLNLFKVNFTGEEWRAAFAYHRGKGFSQAHHSKYYNEVYHPHYRLIRQGLWELEDIEIQ